MVYGSVEDQGPERLDARALGFWASPTMALLAEERPGRPLFTAFRDFVVSQRRVKIEFLFGLLPDYADLRADLGLSLEDAAALNAVSPATLNAVERYWLRISSETAFFMCDCYGVAIGALFHNTEFQLRPSTRGYLQFLGDAEGAF